MLFVNGARPGGQLASSDCFDGPSGVLVCCEDHIIYRHVDVPQHRVAIPRRKHPLNDSNRGLIITAAVMHKMKVSEVCCCRYSFRANPFAFRAHSFSCSRAKTVICIKSRSSTKWRQ
jgi:hypothetical protein